MKLSVFDIAQAVNALSVTKDDMDISGQIKDIFVSGVTTDSRNVPENSLFIAIKGEHFDGNQFCDIAVLSGACAVIASDKTLATKGVVIEVEDTRKALLDLARYYRKTFDIKICGVTGSVGKTSTKEMIYAVLSEGAKTLKTEGNFNNEIGLPKTLFNVDETYKYAVIEMGMSNFGEISRLSKTTLPDIAVITNIGVSHIENLKTRENIKKAKFEILEGLEPGATVVLNFDNDMLKGTKLKDYNVVTYGVEGKYDVSCENVVEGERDTEFDIVYMGERYHAKICAIGPHNILNALCAFAVGVNFGIDPKVCAESVVNYRTTGMRQNIVDMGKYTFIEDCYNAAPDSMKSALCVLSKVGGNGRKIAVLGDMLELGDMSNEFHTQLGKQILENKVDLVFYFGRQGENVKKGAGGQDFVRLYDNKMLLCKELLATLEEGDTILFKSSRGMRLEEIIEKVKGSI